MREVAVGNALSPTVDSRLAVRSVRTLTTITVFALNWCQLHVEVRHRDIPASGYADSGRRGPTVCTRHAVVLATSAGHEEVALRSRTSNLSTNW